MNARIRLWRYSAETTAGEVVSGVVEAADLPAAETAIRSKRLALLSLAEQKSLFGVSSVRADSPTLSELASLTAKLRDLLVGGIPVAHALRIAAKQSKGREREFLQGLLENVQAGKSLTVALSSSRFATPKLMVALIEAGEALGALGSQFEILARHFDEALKLRRELVGQLIYPAALLTLMVATLFFLSFLILPQFESVFATADATPPPETRFVLAAGAAIRRYWFLAPAFLAIAAVVFPLLRRRFETRFEAALLATPFAGRLIRMAEFGLFLRTLATLLQGGTPIARALPLARGAISLRILDAELTEVEGAVRIGERVSTALKTKSACPPELILYAEIGEETGELGGLIGQAATRAEMTVQSSLRRMATLVAPIMTAMMGLLTAGVIAAVMTGVLSLNEAVY